MVTEKDRLRLLTSVGASGFQSVEMPQLQGSGYLILLPIRDSPKIDFVYRGHFSYPVSYRSVLSDWLRFDLRGYRHRFSTLLLSSDARTALS
jgi:hypothetical protein